MMKRTTIFGTPTSTDTDVMLELAELAKEEASIAKVERETKEEEKERRRRVKGGIRLNLIQ